MAKTVLVTSNKIKLVYTLLKIGLYNNALLGFKQYCVRIILSDVPVCAVDLQTAPLEVTC